MKVLTSSSEEKRERAITDAIVSQRKYNYYMLNMRAKKRRMDEDRAWSTSQRKAVDCQEDCAEMSGDLRKALGERGREVFNAWSRLEGEFRAVEHDSSPGTSSCFVVTSRAYSETLEPSGRLFAAIWPCSPSVGYRKMRLSTRRLSEF